MSADVIVVVDGWNLRNQGRDVLGTLRHPTANGIVASLAPYGFNVTEIHYALGVTNATNRRSDLLEDALRRNCAQMTAIAADPRVTPLNGKLAERDERGGATRIEEKHIDVLCALAIAAAVTRIREHLTTARAIVVISEDMDFEPAYEHAEAFGVPVYAAANETVHRRRGRWVLLGEWAMATMLEPTPGTRHSSRLRTSICRFAHYFDQVPLTFKAGTFDHGSGTRSFRHRDGAIGNLSCDSGDHLPGESAQLYAVDIDLGEQRTEFPRLKLSPTARPAACPNILEANVVDWIDPTRARIEYLSDGSQGQVGIPLGMYPPGTTVLIQAPPKLRPVLVGAGDAPAKEQVWEERTKPRLVKVTDATIVQGAVTASMTTSGTSVTMRVLPGVRPRVGGLFACLPVRLSPGNWEVIPVTSHLPDPA